jgi:hypothetical protein
MTKLFFDRKDLMIGSLIGAMLGPLSVAPMFDSLDAILAREASGGLFTTFGVVCYVYVIGRAVIDVVSDLMEWRVTPKLFAMPLPRDSPKASDPRNTIKITLLMLEAILFGGGAVLFFVFDPTRPKIVPDLDPALIGQFAVMIGALTFYERNVILLYPFHFRDWLGLRTDRNE